jgi:hypothetical protein
VKYLIAIVVFLALGLPMRAQDAKMTAAALLTDCQQTDIASEHKAFSPEKNGHPFQWNKTDKEETGATYLAGYCAGYISGWREGRDQSEAVIDGRAYVITVPSANLDNVIAALQNHLTATPLDKDKRADDILFQVFLDNKLIQLQEIPVKATTVSVPCGAPTAYRLK